MEVKKRMPYLPTVSSVKSATDEKEAILLIGYTGSDFTNRTSMKTEQIEKIQKWTAETA